MQPKFNFSRCLTKLFVGSPGRKRCSAFYVHFPPSGLRWWVLLPLLIFFLYERARERERERERRLSPPNSTLQLPLTTLSVMLWCLHLLIGWFSGRVVWQGQSAMPTSNLRGLVPALLSVCVCSFWEYVCVLLLRMSMQRVGMDRVITCINASCFWYACVYVVYSGRGFVCVCVRVGWVVLI